MKKHVFILKNGFSIKFDVENLTSGGTGNGYHVYHIKTGTVFTTTGTVYSADNIEFSQSEIAMKCTTFQ